MKIWKIITVLLAVLLLAGCVGCVSGAVVNKVDVTVTAPVTGIDKTNAATSTTGVKVSTTKWNSELTYGQFEASTNYTVTVTLTNSSKDYSFTSPLTAKINGKDATVNSVSSNQVVISYTFPKTAAAKTISDIRCTLEEPKASNTPKTTVTFTEPTTGLKSTVTWDTTDKKFVLGKTYKATIVIESTNAKAYPITSTATVKFNGETINNLERGTNKITFTYTFDETEPKGTADILSFTVNAPTVGSNPSNYIRINAHDDKIAATAAWDTTSAFQPDKPYTVTITVLAKEGYVIKSGATAKVNGNNAIIVQEGNNKATVTYTFEEIESVSSVNVNFDAPKAGEIAQKTTSAVTTVPYDAADSASISWSPALVNDEFDSGVAYTATVVIKETRADAVFDAETIVYINGEIAQTTVSSDYKTITAVYTFPKTFFFPNPLDIIKEFYNLMLAFFNPASYAF